MKIKHMQGLRENWEVLKLLGKVFARENRVWRKESIQALKEELSIDSPDDTAVTAVQLFVNELFPNSAMKEIAVLTLPLLNDGMPCVYRLELPASEMRPDSTKSTLLQLSVKRI